MERDARNLSSETSRGGELQIEQVMPGAEVITVGEEQLALGFPEEVVKAWLRAGKRVTAWLIPDLRSAGGLVQWALEFPLYHALFVQGCFARGRRVPVLAAAEDWPEVVLYLRLTLLGLAEDELLREGVDAETAAMLLAEGRHLALKHADGRVAQIEELLEPHLFDAEGVAELGALRVKRHGDNTYSFFTADDRIEEHRLEPGAALPPYADRLPAASAPVVPQPFELIALGTSHGFDPTGPCSNLVVQTNGRFVVIDCGPYIRTTLEHAGIGLDQVGAVILTHAHEDHAVGLSALLEVTHRLTLFATRETLAVMRRKLAILNPTVSSPATLLDDAFQPVPVRAGEEQGHLGLRLRFHYTMHSIPCTGVELAMREGDRERRLLVVGDNNSRANIERAAAAGVLSPARLEQLLALYAWDGEVAVVDAGGGMIHGLAGDFRSSPTSVVCVHTSGLPEEDRAAFTVAAPGHRYLLIAETPRPTSLERGLASKALLSAFTGADPDWLNVLLDAATSLSVNRGQVVLREAERSRDVYLTLSGELAVLGSGGRLLASLHAGELFGEMAAVNDAPRSATVRATTPARLLRIPGATFRRFVHALGLAQALPELWRRRADLERVPIFSAASVTTRNRLAGEAVRRTLPPGTTLIRQGSASTTVYVLVQGRVQVYRGSEPLLVRGAPVTLDPGTVIGETAPFLEQARNASIVTLDECEVLAIRGGEFKRIVHGSPQLHCQISRIVKQRQAAA